MCHKGTQINWCQFYQPSMSSFYTHRSQKRKKDRQLDCLFALSGSWRLKAAPGLYIKLTPGAKKLQLSQ